MAGVDAARIDGRASRRRLAASVALVAVVLGVGCTREMGARDVTPWLRLEAWRPSDFPIAEAGQNYDRVRLRVRRNGSWYTLEENAGDCAFPIANGSRVVVGEELVRRDGSIVRLDCNGRLLPQGDGVTCFEHGPDPHAPMTLTFYDRDGRRRGQQSLAMPPGVPVYPRPMGHRGEDWLFVTQFNPDPPLDPLAPPGLPRPPTECGAFAIRATGDWHEVRPLGDCQQNADAVRAMSSGPIPTDSRGVECAY